MQFFPFSLMNSQNADGSFGPLADFSSAKAKGLGKAKGFMNDANDASASFANMLEGKFSSSKEDIDARRANAFGIWDRAGSGVKALAGSGLKAATGASFVLPSDMRGAQGDGTLNLRALAAHSGTGALPGMKELSALKMTREDFLSLKKGLRSYGLAKSDIDALEERISSEGGLTWGQFMAALSDQMVAMGKNFSAVELSQTETRELTNLFQKIGFTPQKTEELLGKLRSGKFGAVWDEVGEKFASLPGGASITVTSSELATLGKVMQLSEAGQSRLVGLMNGASSATLDPQSLGTLMTVLKAEVAADAQVDADTNQALGELVGEALSKASERAGLSAKADNRVDNSERNQKILSEHNRRERAREEAAQNGNSRSAHGDGEEGHAARVMEADPRSASAKSASGHDAAAQNRADADGKDAKSGSTADAKSGRYIELARTGGDAEAKGEGGETKSDDADTAWKDMWGKVRSGSRSAVDPMQNANRFAAAQANVERAAESALKGMDREVASRALRQVESGILKNMGPGKTLLVLRLEPQDLGKLNMILQMKDGEVSATFRAETQDAHRMLSENLSQLRTQLEQQGIKVGKMEVQTQLSGDQNSNQWLGEGGHNQAREQENMARRSGMMRRLRGEADELAQEMHNEPRTARIAREGLDIIA